MFTIIKCFVQFFINLIYLDSWLCLLRIAWMVSHWVYLYLLVIELFPFDRTILLYEIPNSPEMLFSSGTIPTEDSYLVALTSPILSLPYFLVHHLKTYHLLFLWLDLIGLVLFFGTYKYHFGSFQNMLYVLAFVC